MLSDDRRRRVPSCGRLSVLLLVVSGLAPAAVCQAQQGADVRLAARGSAGAPAVQRIVQEGVTAELRLRPDSASSSGRLVELSDFTVSLVLTDSATGAPLSEMNPAAWIDVRRGNGPTDAEMCGQKISAYVRGTLRFRPAVDLNSFYVLALARGPEIAVIDPLLGFGRSKLYTTVLLPGPGADWVLSPDERSLFVTVPSDGQVSVVDTDTWDVAQNIEAGARPTRIRLQPDGRRLWVTNEGDDAGGVTVIDAALRTVVARIPTGAGPHTLAFDPDDRLVFVANEGAGTVTVIDAETLAPVKDIPTGEGPSGLAYSPMTREVYVIHRGAGTLVAVDAKTLEAVYSYPLEPGLHAIRLVPMASGGHGHHGAAMGVAGRLGFIVNRDADRVHIFDVVGRRLVRTVEVFDRPDQIAFSASFAYIRSQGSEQVTMVPLADPVSGGVGAFDHFPVGEAAPAEAGPLGIAAGITRSPDMPDAVFAVNPQERAIYYYHYMEGMPTPSGSLSTYGFEPLGVLTVGRRLRETAPGVYSATVRLQDPGDYDFVLLLPEPRIVHCFGFTVLEDPALHKGELALRLEPLDDTTLETGGARLRLRLYDAYTGEPQVGVKDLRFYIMATSGWKRRIAARPVGDGTYELDVAFPDAGVYYLSFEVPSLGFGLRDQPPLMLHVVNGDAAGR
ncbi:MAG TPA: cytochrome D1 domain-containing protein [Longimicrobiales bacterium]